MLEILEGKVEVEETNFIRDLNSKALLNTDLNARQMHRENLMRLEKERLQQINTRDEVKQLKEEVSEIKQLLLELVNRKIIDIDKGEK